MKRIVPIFSLLFLVACDSTPNIMECGEYNVSITTNEESITVDINGDTAQLAHVVAASGARFEGVVNDIPITMWSKGDDWTLILDNDQIYDCN